MPGSAVLIYQFMWDKSRERVCLDWFINWYYICMGANKVRFSGMMNVKLKCSFWKLVHQTWMRREPSLFTGEGHHTSFMEFFVDDMTWQSIYHSCPCKAFLYVDAIFRSDSKMQSRSKYGIYRGNAAAHDMQCHSIWVTPNGQFVLTNHVWFHDLEFPRLADKLKIAEDCGFPI